MRESQTSGSGLAPDLAHAGGDLHQSLALRALARMLDERLRCACAFRKHLSIKILAHLIRPTRWIWV